MKKINFFAILFTVSVCSFGQTTLFQENWDGIGPGIGSWTFHNIDGLTPVGPSGSDGEALSFLIQNAWNVLSLPTISNALPSYTSYPSGALGMSNNVVASNSWYDPFGISNDWLVSPLITIPAGATGVNLSWAAASVETDPFMEDYEVYISPSGGTNVSNFTTLLVDVNDELTSGSLRNVSLNAYVGTSFRIAFRDNSDDKYVLFLDNIKITASTLSSESFNLSNIRIFPNPAKNILNIQSDGEEITKITIVDMNGRIVKEVSSDLNQISLENLAKGIYNVTVHSANVKKVQKIIIE